MTAPSDKSLGEKTGINSALGLSPSTVDFVNQAAISDMFEIQSSRLAMEQDDPDIKPFAEQMIADHSKTSDQLKAMVQQRVVSHQPPAEMDAKHQKKVEDLKAMYGAQFAKQYLADQVTAHKDAVSLFERYADGGDNPQLRDWAGRTLPTLKQHLKMAEDMKDRAGGDKD